MEFGAVASGFGHLLASQVSGRLVTFSLNLLIARHLTPEAYGLSAIQFHLVTTIIMTLSREGFRRGCLRFQPTTADSKVEPWQVLSVAWLVVPLGAAVSAATCAVVLRLHSASAHIAGQQQEAVPGYATAIALHGVAAVVELLAEPLYILASVQLQFRLRAVLDTAPLAVKSLATLAAVGGWLGPRVQAAPPALMFAAAQLAMSSVTLLGYVLSVGLPLLTSARQRAGATDAAAAAGGRGWGEAERQVLSITAVFSLQAAAKLVLSEGSKLVLAGVASPADQGVVGLVGNLGSLVVRTLFLPLEEVAFAAFSRQHAEGSVVAGDSSKQLTSSSSSSKGGAMQQASELLGLMSRAVCLLGLLVCCFGPPNAYLAIRLVYGSGWATTSAPAVLSVYCAYVLLLALNGVTEAFVHAVLDARSLAWSNVLLLAFTVAHVGACMGLVQWGGVGLVAADALNMLLRITASLWYIRRHFEGMTGFSVQSLLPSTGSLAVLTGAAAVLHLSKHALTSLEWLAPESGGQLKLKGAAMQVLVALVALMTVAVCLWRTERSTLRALRSIAGRSRRHDAAKKQA